MLQFRTSRVGGFHFDVQMPSTNIRVVMSEFPISRHLKLSYTDYDLNVIVGFDNNKQCTSANITYDVSTGYFPNGKLIYNLPGDKSRVAFSLSTYKLQFGSINGIVHVLMNKLYLFNGILFCNIFDYMVAVYGLTTVLKQYINTGLCTVKTILTHHDLHLVHLPRHYAPDMIVAAYSGGQIIHIPAYKAVLLQLCYFGITTDTTQITLDNSIHSVTAGYALDVLSHKDWPSTTEDIVRTAELLSVWCASRPDTIRALNEVLEWCK